MAKKTQEQIDERFPKRKKEMNTETLATETERAWAW